MDKGLFYILAVNLVIWLGIALYLFNLDRKITQLEKEKDKGK